MFYVSTSVHVLLWCFWMLLSVNSTESLVLSERDDVVVMRTDMDPTAEFRIGKNQWENPPKKVTQDRVWRQKAQGKGHYASQAVKNKKTNSWNRKQKGRKLIIPWVLIWLWSSAVRLGSEVSSAVTHDHSSRPWPNRQGSPAPSRNCGSPEAFRLVLQSLHLPL